MNILSPLKEKAILFTHGDNTLFPLWYLWEVERRRQDVTIIDEVLLASDTYGEKIKRRFKHISFVFSSHGIKRAYPDVIEKIQRERFNNIVTYNIKKYPIYINYKKNGGNYFLLPEGILYRILEDNIREQDINRLNLKYRGAYNKEGIFKDWRVLPIIKKYENIHTYRGKLYFEKKFYSKAIIECKNALKINPDSIETLQILGASYHNLGLLYFQKSEFEKAIEEYKKAIEINPQPDTYVNIAFIYYLQKNYGNAISAYKKALKLDQKNIRARRDLSTLYYNINLFDKAYLECKQVLRLDPDNTYAKQMLAECKKKLLDKQR